MSSEHTPQGFDALKALLGKRSPEDRIFGRLALQFSFALADVLNKRGWTQKNLAEAMGKRPSEINKWLSGKHNVELRTVAKIEAVLGEKFLDLVSLPHQEELAKEKAASFEVLRFTPQPLPQTLAQASHNVSDTSAGVALRNDVLAA